MAIKNPPKGLTLVKQTRVVEKGHSPWWKSLSDTFDEACDGIYTPAVEEVVWVPKEEE